MEENIEATRKLCKEKNNGLLGICGQLLEKTSTSGSFSTHCKLSKKYHAWFMNSKNIKKNKGFFSKWISTENNKKKDNNNHHRNNDINVNDNNNNNNNHNNNNNNNNHNNNNNNNNNNDKNNMIQLPHFSRCIQRFDNYW